MKRLAYTREMPLVGRREFLAFPWVLTAADPQVHWPSFRGAEASGVADGFPLPVAWKAKWKTAVPGLGHSSPVIWGNKLFVATAVSALGKAPLKLGLYGDRDAADDNGEQSWKVLCFDKRNGRLLWERTARKSAPRAQRHMKATHANTTVATNGERVVAFFGSEGLHCFDLDGRAVWSKDLGTINVSKYGVGWGYASSPALHGDRIVLQIDAPDDPYLAAFRLSDGERVWRTARKDACERSWATPLVYRQANRTQVVANGWPYVASYDLETGRELWRLKGGGDNPIPAPFAAHGMLYVANGHGAEAPVWAIKPEAKGDISGSDFVVWTERRNGAYIQTPLVYRDWLYSGTNNGVLKCYDARTGKMHYQQRLGAGLTGFSASPVAGDGKVYCASEDGDVWVIAAGAEYRELARHSLGDSVMATPAISEGALYFRTREALVAVAA
ncbi:MAG: PQQ-binding-like beta-propeller repeat protein [Bryobacterales bacterium]|nr:PQQ-binding-like beta-propeller repeat protein [Bryobacterales bacterium]